MDQSTYVKSNEVMILTEIYCFRLESQCVTAISFVKNEPELLDSPIWILIINIVALEMLKAKLPQGESYKWCRTFLLILLQTCAGPGMSGDNL